MIYSLNILLLIGYALTSYMVVIFVKFVLWEFENFGIEVDFGMNYRNM
jgi:hypothetical protein